MHVQLSVTGVVGAIGLFVHTQVIIPDVIHRNCSTSVQVHFYYAYDIVQMGTICK